MLSSFSLAFSLELEAHPWPVDLGSRSRLTEAPKILLLVRAAETVSPATSSATSASSWREIRSSRAAVTSSAGPAFIDGSMAILTLPNALSARPLSKKRC